MRAAIAITLTALVLAAALPRAAGQDRGAGASAITAKASAPVDLTGYWVALVTEDWRFRMVTPRKGDYRTVPLTEEARKIADTWDPAADEAAGNQCKAYGAGAAALTCSSERPCFIKSRMRSRMIVTISRYSTTSS